MARLGLWLVSLALCAALHGCVEMEDAKGYKITVAISKDVPEDLDILTQLQDAFKGASEYLYTASRNYVYFSHVTILVPETWTKKPEWSVSTDLTFKEADVRVDAPNPAQGDNPYTFQPGLCGEEGRYIHLTKDFVLDNGIKRDFYYGAFDRLLVHEFAHLRYGVFDEYGERGTSQHPVYYLEGATLRPTACSHEIEGIFVDMEADERCSLPFSKDCDFNVDKDGNTAVASIMFAQFLEKVTSFCESAPLDSRLKHNPDAPNKHNKMCNGKGTWDVIKEHVDIKYGNTDPVADREPVFKIAQRQTQVVNDTKVCGRRFVFVLDVSKSMQKENRYFKLRQMADKIIRDILPVGTEVGITVFSNQALVKANMRFLKTDTDRETLAGELPVYEEFIGGTAIGQGLLTGISMLKDGGKTAEGGRIFLLTDGEQTVFPFVSSILSNITKEKVTIHTLALGEDADPVLQELSKLTSGQYSYFDESADSTAIEGAGERLLNDINLCDEEDTGVEIDRHAEELDSTSPSYERTVLIDSTVGNNTLFVFTLSNGKSTEVSVTDPNGVVFNEDSSEYSKDETLNIIRFRFPLTEAGYWSYKLKRSSTGTESVVGVVKSNPRTPGTLPYEIESWLSSTSFDFAMGEGLAVYAYVHQGQSPIIKAKVTVIVKGYDSSGDKIEIKKDLLDDGLFPDNTEDDGIYTNYVLGFKSDSRYSLEVTAMAEDDTVVLKSGNLLSGAPVSYRNQTFEVTYETVENFSRVASVGAVDIKGFIESEDQLDPGRVIDLEATVSDRDNKEIILAWTAPGDDLNEGTVTRYDIRVAKTFEDLRGNFSDSYGILATDIVGGSDTPVPAGSQQNMTVSLPGHLNTDRFVFGLKAIDDSGRTSELSNLKAATFEEVILPQPTTTTPASTSTMTSTSTTAPEETTSLLPDETTTSTSVVMTSTNSNYTDAAISNKTGMFISAGVGGGVLLVVAIVVVSLVCIKLRRPTTPTKPQQLFIGV